ncbi:PEP-CTERM sorting domain-containing protein [Sphingomonas prati]|uniref:Uncharacterized protein n=1 Tax=Sphingomonas prati TaxID=1843237 RepID=A0A7W9F2S1_9SPHN|nr:PEP-CTERM sorting domain-containing protein [Sphingomonas prati]MBB5729079.1 hypothetical protein [Sphingomonas prati]
MNGDWRMLIRTIAALGILAAGGQAGEETILFVGNSFTYGANSDVHRYRADSVTDLNGEGVGGVPALFKTFADEAGLAYTVSLETGPGKGLGWHWRGRRGRIDAKWDHVVMQDYSTLDVARPGDPTALVDHAARLAGMFRARNAKVDVRLASTWSRADETYKPGGHWYGRPIAAMADDVRAGYDRAGRAARATVVPVGQAWTLAMTRGVADPNPYDGTTFGQLDLWSWDQYHASSAGYYLSALTIFGSVTGRDPMSLGRGERAAADLGLSPDQAVALQRVAHDRLAAER